MMQHAHGHYTKTEKSENKRETRNNALLVCLFTLRLWLIMLFGIRRENVTTIVCHALELCLYELHILT